jgi:hypothetical protein
MRVSNNLHYRNATCFDWAFSARHAGTEAAIGEQR